MPTIQQRLQSRISLRRNAIREMEVDVSIYKAHHQRHLAKRLRGVITVLGQDQKLDKELYIIAGEYVRLLEIVIEDSAESMVQLLPCVVSTPRGWGNW